ncbi:winged helix-turn-helix domain-containing protein [Streptacidiphilus sp. EB103A]|uniref:winged helix-turn-helix domain-containing protein n=1 Tax=Streptacidiphilus sp. EB103A TaxID=3156275 RepID=UPI0035165E80
MTATVQSRRRDAHVPQANPRGTYLQISESLRQDIQAGKITDRLPSKAELMRLHGVGASTVERALAVLTAEGLLECRSKGAACSSPAPATAVHTHLMPSSDDRARKAMDRVFRAPDLGLDGPQTAPEP